MLLAKGVEIQIFYEIARWTLFNRMHHMHFVVKLEIRTRDIWLKSRRSRGPVSRKHEHAMIHSIVDVSSNTSPSHAIFIVWILKQAVFRCWMLNWQICKQERSGNSPLDQNVWVTCGRESSQNWLLMFFSVFHEKFKRPQKQRKNCNNIYF